MVLLQILPHLITQHYLNTGLTLTFEGATANAHETTLTVTDPSTDRTITLSDATGTVSLLDNTETLTNKTLTSAVLNTGVSGTAVLDEDNMSSDSATQLATQQSIKAYVDTETGNVASDTMTLTNKTFDVEGTGNSISNIDVADFKLK